MNEIPKEKEDHKLDERKKKSEISLKLKNFFFVQYPRRRNRDHAIKTNAINCVVVFTTRLDTGFFQK